VCFDPAGKASANRRKAILIFEMMKIGFIGTGNMATALIRSMKDNNKIISSDKNSEKLQKAVRSWA